MPAAAAALHAAAPCPVPIKREMIEWWGPIINEYYAGSEGIGMTLIKAEDWLTHPGSVGKAIQNGFNPVKVGSTILGLEVPHVHIHVVPIWTPFDLDFANADPDAKAEDIAEAAATIRAGLRTLARPEVSD